ncbi:elongator complex protein 6-like [Lineus longissimus]|uniref:elongator complex protein 6-like n=1 Tax=Lineus longissimus TaxID=88925 RepID=UPI00315D510E
MFTELNNILLYEQGNTPSGKLISIFQDFRSDSSYLIHHFLTYFLKAGDSVCLVGLAQSFGHYNNVGQKLGLNLKALRDDGKVVFIEGLRLCGNTLIGEDRQDVGSCGDSDYEKMFDGLVYDKSKNSLRPIYSYLSSKVKQLQDSGNRKTHIIFDDISILLALGVESRSLMVFIDYLQTLLSSSGNVVVRGLMDEDMAEDELVAKYLYHKSHATLVTRGLASGYCKDVHGQIEIKVKEPSAGHPQNQKSTRMQYKVQDKNVHFFASGTSSAVL